jgi:hypothetical protein
VGSSLTCSDPAQGSRPCDRWTASWMVRLADRATPVGRRIRGGPLELCGGSSSLGLLAVVVLVAVALNVFRAQPTVLSAASAGFPATCGLFRTRSGCRGLDFAVYCAARRRILRVTLLSESPRLARAGADQRDSRRCAAGKIGGRTWRGSWRILVGRVRMIERSQWSERPSATH